MRKLFGIIICAATVLAIVFIIAGRANAPVVHHTAGTAAPGLKTATQQTIAFNKQQYSTTDPRSIWIIVNKLHPLQPINFVPVNLQVPHIPLRSSITGDEKFVSSQMKPALEALVAGAKTQGVSLNLQSGYRSYNFQQSLYGSYVRSQGQAVADRQSARPGYSEHQTGLAADLGGFSNPSCNVAPCFGDTVEGKWLAENAYLYGFIVRYPLDKEAITGYEYEPWHIRYVGTALAAELHKNGVTTLEEYFNIKGGMQYKT